MTTELPSWEDRMAEIRERHRIADETADRRVEEMRAAGYTVREHGDYSAAKVTVTLKDGKTTLWRYTTSCTAGRAEAVARAHAKWHEHREAVQP